MTDTQTSDNELFMLLLEAIRNEGIADPNVEVFYNTISGNVEGLKAAIAAGANVNIGDGVVVEYHRPLLARKCPEQLREWDRRRVGLGK